MSSYTQDVKHAKKFTKNCMGSAIDKKAYSLLHTSQLSNYLHELQKQSPEIDCASICENASICQKLRNENIKILKDILATKETECVLYH